MHELNSVLLEGTLTEDPRLVPIGEEHKVCRFFIRNERKDGVLTIEIRAHNGQARNCFEYLKKGRGVRVVGWLVSEVVNSHEEINIVAEHVEFRSAEVGDG